MAPDDALRKRLRTWIFDAAILYKQHVWSLASAKVSDSVSIDILSPSEWEASGDILETIAAWLPSSDRPRVGIPLQTPTTDAIHGWIRDEVVVMLRSSTRTKDHTLGEPIALAAIKFYGDRCASAEIGRLIVNPKFRRHGIGAALITNLANAIQAVTKSTKLLTIFSRVLASNEDGLALVLRLQHYHETNDFKSLTTDLDPSGLSCRWFIWGHKAAAAKIDFGSSVRSLRNARKLSQQVLAQRAHLSREAVNLLEKNASRPSVENIPRIIDALDASIGLTTKDCTRLLYAAVDRDVPPDLVFPGDIENEANSSTHLQHRWILSDKFLEEIDEAELQRSSEALINGFYRIYMFPKTLLAQGEIPNFIIRMRDATILKAGSSQTAVKYLRQLRLFTAPTALCRFRIAVFDADPLGPWNDNLRPVSIGINPDSSKRAPLHQLLANAVISDIAGSIKKLISDNPRETASKTDDGFAVVPLP